MRKLATLFIGLLVSFAAAGATDSDSFGRSVRYLDVAISEFYLYGTGVTTCPATVPATSHCTAIPAGTAAQLFSEADVAHIDLPARATNSLLCFSTTSTLGFRFSNTTTAPINGLASIVTTATIESTALRNPALINKATGLPFDGKIVSPGITNYLELKTVPPNSQEQKSLGVSKECINGLISLRTLQSLYGLTLAQARAVFAAPMTVRLSVDTRATNVSSISWTMGIRLFGD